MSDDETRLVYTDDPELRSLVGAWLERHEMQDAQRRVKLEATIEASADEPITGQTAAGDTRRLRGLPAIGRGVGGAISGTDPLRVLLKKERQRARLDELLKHEPVAADRDDRSV